MNAVGLHRRLELDMKALRPPLGEIRQWDDMACEAACVAQLLYMHGKLEYPFDVTAFDKRIGRQAGQADIARGALRLLLEAGFELVSISAVDGRRVAEDSSYVAYIWRKMGMDESDIASAMETTYPLVRHKALNTLALLEEFSHQCTEHIRESRWEDVTELLEAGYAVTCNIGQPVAGYTPKVLITRRLRKGKCEVFNPAAGVMACYGREHLAPWMLPDVGAFRLVS